MPQGDGDLPLGVIKRRETDACGPYGRFARRRRRRRGVLASGSRSPVGVSAYRSIRMTGRMMMAADSDLPAIDLGPRAPRCAAWKLITVPISLPPSPDGRSRNAAPARFEAGKVNGLLTRSP